MKNRVMSGVRFLRVTALVPVFLGGFSAPDARAADGALLSGRVRAVEGQPRFEVSWSAVSGAVYRVDARSYLESGSPDWKGQDVVSVTTNSVGPLRWMSPEATTERAFYRVHGPDTELTAAEPAVFAPGAPQALYLAGQGFESDDTVQVDGASAGGVEFLDPFTLRVTLPPQAPGVHRVAVVRGGAVIATFDVVCASPASSPEILQELASLPPAAPMGLAHRGKGHVTVLKAAENGGDDVDEDGDSPRDDAALGSRAWFGKAHERKGHVTLIKRLMAPATGEDQDCDNGGDGTDGDPLGLVRAWRGHVTVLKAAQGGGDDTDDDCDGTSDDFSFAARGGHKKTGHVSLLKRGSDPDPASAARGGHQKTGHVTLMKREIGGGGGLNDWPGAFELETYSGELQHRVVDMHIPGRGLDFVWARTYRSRTGSSSSMGHGWTHAYDVRVEPDGGDLVLFDGTGRRDRFVLQTNGTYACDGLFYELTVTSLTPRIRFPWGGEWRCHPLDGSPAAGCLAASVDASSNTMTFAYDGAGRLSEIVDSLGRTNRLAYSSDGRVASITDFAGRSVSYQYHDGLGTEGGPGDLASATTPPVLGTPNGNDFVDGKTTHYAYTMGSTDERLNHNLVRVTDPLGQTWLQVYYLPETSPTNADFDAVDGIRRGNDLVHLRRVPQTPVPANGFATVKAIYRDGVGNVSERLFDARNRCVCIRDFTGRADPARAVTEIENRPQNRLRPGDPDYFETRCAWTIDNLPSRVDWPASNATVFIYQRGIDKKAIRRSAGDLRVLREIAGPGGADTDGDGAPDATERAWYAEYDARFGSPPLRVRGGRCNVADWFATRVVDPRGFATTCAYDGQGNCVRLTWPAPDAAVDCAYNAHGQLVALTHAPDGEGRRRVVTFAYHASGPQAGFLSECAVDATGPAPARWSYEYDARGNLVRCWDPITNDWLTAYNALDQVMLRESPTLASLGTNRIRRVYAYDACDRVVQTDRSNCDQDAVPDASNPFWTTRRQYDALDRCVRVEREIDPLHDAATQFSYDANDNLVFVQSPLAVSGAEPNNTVACDYDERDLPFRVRRAPGSADASVCRLDYDGNARCVRVERGLDDNLPPSASGPVTTFGYDGFGRCVSAATATVNLRRCTCDLADHVRIERVYSGTNRLAEVRYDVDALGRRVRVHALHFDAATQAPIGDGEDTTTCAYAPNGTRIRVTDDLGRVSSVRYDRRHTWSVAQVTDPASNSVSYAYDALGRRIAAVETNRSDLGGAPQTFAMSWAYDRVSRCTNIWDNLGNGWSYAYNALGGCVRRLDAKGLAEMRDFDGLGRCTRAVGDLDGDGIPDLAADSARLWAWDDNSRLASVTDDNTNTTTFAYDALDRCVAVLHADGTSRHSVYDRLGNVVTNLDPNGTVVACVYEAAASRLIRRDVACAVGIATTTTFEIFAYDGLSRLVMASNDAARIDFRYDSLGRCVQHRQDGLASTRTYDGVGNLLTLTYPGGGTVTYAYDALDRPVTVSRTFGGSTLQIAAYAYDGPDRLASIQRPMSIRTFIRWNGKMAGPNSPDDFGWKQVSQVCHTSSVYGVVDERVCAYDRDQQKTLRAQTVAFSPAALPSTNIWAYDALGRLHLAVQTKGTGATRTTAYALDGNGNRTAVIRDGLVSAYTRDPTLPEPADFQMDQYTQSPFGYDQYNHNGNLAQRDSTAGTLAFTRDYADRLVHVDRISGGVTEPVASYAYDALGRLIKRRGYGTLPSVTDYIHGGPDEDNDCGGPVVEVRQGTDIRILVWGRALGDLDRDGCPDVVVASFDSLGHGQHYLHDDLGSVLAVSDDSGTVLERCDYDDYGSPEFLSADGLPLVDTMGMPLRASSVGNPFLFRGLFWDEDAGLYFVVNAHTSPFDLRAYDPQTGHAAVRGPTCASGACGSSDRTVFGDNPWSDGKDQDCDGVARAVGDKFAQVRGSSHRVEGIVANRRQYVLKKEEGGRHTPFHNRSRPLEGRSGETRSTLKSYFETGDIPAQEKKIKAIGVNGEGKKEYVGHVTLLK